MQFDAVSCLLLEFFIKKKFYLTAVFLFYFALFYYFIYSVAFFEKYFLFIVSQICLMNCAYFLVEVIVSPNPHKESIPNQYSTCTNYSQEMVSHNPVFYAEAKT